VRCARCGNDNPGTNRFCGMCGATLLRPPVRAPQSSAQVPAGPPAQSPAAPVPPATPVPVPSPARAEAPAAAPPVAVPQETPVISGPSFLGLNESVRPAEPRRPGSLSIDPNSTPSSGSLDYLLQDEDGRQPGTGGAVKYVLILIALALAVGLGYLRFKNQGLAWLKGSTSKPTAAQTSDAPDSTTAPPAPTGPVNSAPASGTTSPTTTAATPGAIDLPAPGSAPASSATTPASSAPASPPPSATPAAPISADAAAPTDAPSNSAPKHAPKPQPAQDLSDPNVNPAPSAKPRPAAKAPRPVEPAAPAKPLDPVVEAQNYIYGRGGVRQDCERGLHILKPAADQSNPKAMVEMGALYSAGLCTPRDLPTAYRWFALALRKDPDNQSVQTDLQKLWGEMTQPERQLAIKLSQ
jgi:hypothetical protein